MANRSDTSMPNNSHAQSSVNGRQRRDFASATKDAHSDGRGTIDPRVTIGHTHLKVSDLERSLAFYCGVLGFGLMARYGREAAFVSAGGYHHHIGLNTWQSRGGRAPAPGTTGLFHVALLYPDRPALAEALYRLDQAGITLDGASDHGVSEALYLHDPDENGLELYWDRPEKEWPRTADGKIDMYTRPLDIQALMRDR